MVRDDFQTGCFVCVQLDVPDVIMRVMESVAQITGANRLCVAGGFVRGLYMQQRLHLDPQMNDIDVFVDMPISGFEPCRPWLEDAFGAAQRFHTGVFEYGGLPHGLIDFSLPVDLYESCAGAKSLQLNFGPSHKWSDPYDYIMQANLSINQIAIGANGRVIATPAFLRDMSHQTISMNAERLWTVNDWERTHTKLVRMCAERPEFNGWSPVLIPCPDIVVTGSFWSAHRLSL